MASTVHIILPFSSIHQVKGVPPLVKVERVGQGSAAPSKGNDDMTLLIGDLLWSPEMTMWDYYHTTVTLGNPVGRDMSYQPMERPYTVL